VRTPGKTKGVDNVNRRKSVTFTPDTKVEDGFSAQSLFADWAAGDDRSSAVEHNNQPQAHPASTSKKEAKKAKRHWGATASFGNTDEASSISNGRVSDEQQPEYLRYLDQYHNDREHWKFNKNHQKELFKNLFNVYRVSSKYDEAIVAYISGLQGAAAQQRLLDEAEGVLKGLLEQQRRIDEIEGMDSRTSRKAVYEAALAREIATIKRSGGGRSEYDDDQLQEIKREVERAKRAESVLATLLTRELAPTPLPLPLSQSLAAAESRSQDASGTSSPSTVEPQSSAPKTITKRRNRKARTEVSDESSSDSSESEGE
jgi:hypothetical protein